MQALEALYVGEANPQGYVVANEMVASRAHVLTARCGALGAACRSLLVTSHRAQIFPRVEGSDGYDRIICDVPCSGDGTFRKHRDKWTHWGPHQGRELHSLQLQIATRAALLLKPGGVMAYSTCRYLLFFDGFSLASKLLFAHRERSTRVLRLHGGC